MIKRNLILSGAVAWLFLVAACTLQKPSSVKFNTQLPMNELMAHVIDPASFGYWKGSGTEDTAAGLRDLSPTTDKGWEDMESSAAALIEAGNALQLPGRPRAPEADWNRYAQALSSISILAKAAAEHHDTTAAFDQGAKIYAVCTACHAQYVIGPQLRANGPAKGNPLPPWPIDFPHRK